MLLNRLLMQCDLIVIVGVIEPHLLLGFSGGKAGQVNGVVLVATAHGVPEDAVERVFIGHVRLAIVQGQAFFYPRLVGKLANAP